MLRFNSDPHDIPKWAPNEDEDADDNMKINPNYWYTKDMNQLILKRIKYIKEYAPNAKILLNIRDFPYAMSKYPGSVIKMVSFSSQLQDEYIEYLA